MANIFSTIGKTIKSLFVDSPDETNNLNSASNYSAYYPYYNNNSDRYISYSINASHVRQDVERTVEDVYANRYQYSQSINTLRNCIDLIANSAADIPIDLYENKEDEVVSDNSNKREIFQLLQKPNFNQPSWGDFLRSTITEFYRNSSIFWIYDKNTKQLFSIRGDTVSRNNTYLSNTSFTSQYNLLFNGKEVTFKFSPLEDLYTDITKKLLLYVYIDGNNNYNNTGCAFLGVAMEIKTAAMGRVALNSIFSKGVNAGAILLPTKIGGNIEDKQSLVNKTKEDLQGASNAGNIVVLSYDNEISSSAPNAEPKYIQLGGNPGDMKYNESIDEAEIRIIASFGIPLPLLRPNTAHYNNMQQSDVQFYARTVSPLLSRILNHLTNFLRPIYNIDERFYFSFSESDIPALKQREGEVAAVQLKNGMITQNEARAVIGYEPIADEKANMLPSIDGSSNMQSDLFVETPEYERTKS